MKKPRRAGASPSGNVGAALGALLPVALGGAGLLTAASPSPVPQFVRVEAVGTPARPASPVPAPQSRQIATEAAAAPADRQAPPAAATPACLSRFGIDLPEQRSDSVARRETLICRRGYVLAFDADTRDPDWVMEHLTPADLQGPAGRSNAFGHDPALPAGADASTADYLRTGYDRGHQAPAGDAKFDQAVMDQSFYFSNMAPQIGIGFNRGAWKFLEETVRAWVLCGGHPDLYVITGPVYGEHPPIIGPDRVAVPSAFFKIVYDPNSGRAAGFVLPNQKIGSRIEELGDYLKPIAWIETETGLNFFKTFDQRRQSQLKEVAGVAWGHTGTCPVEKAE